jgi:hypothetical protein
LDELQLVGYTADLTHLVLSDAAGRSRYRVVLDDDLVATVEEVVGLARPGTELFRPPPAPPPAPPPPPEPEPGGPEPGTGTLAAIGLLVRATTEEQGGADEQDSRLSPREIQALLRAGKSPKQVAKLAGTDESLVRRWLPPILAEREQVLIGVTTARVSKARLGPSREPVGDAVRRNLADKGVSLDDEETTWRVLRRDGDDVWTVELRYRSRGRAQRAIWRFDPETRELDPRNALATEIAWVRPRSGAKASGRATAKRSSGTRSAAKKTSARKATAKKGAGKRSGAKASARKATAKKATAKKAASKSATARKATAKKSASKSATARKAAPKSATAKKVAAKTATAKKATAKKATAKKATAKKTAPRKTTARKASARRATPGSRGTGTGRDQGVVAQRSKRDAAAPTTDGAPPGPSAPPPSRTAPVHGTAGGAADEQS